MPSIISSKPTNIKEGVLCVLDIVRQRVEKQFRNQLVVGYHKPDGFLPGNPGPNYCYLGMREAIRIFGHPIYYGRIRLLVIVFPDFFGEFWKRKEIRCQVNDETILACFKEEISSFAEAWGATSVEFE